MCYLFRDSLIDPTISLETTLRREIEKILGGTTGGKIDPGKMDELSIYLTSKKNIIESILKLDVNPEKPGYFVRSFYQTMGLKLECILKSGKNRVYQIERERLNLWKEILISRGGNRTDGQMNLYSTNTTNDLSKKVG